jgi:hypothetical protein
VSGLPLALNLLLDNRNCSVHHFIARGNRASINLGYDFFHAKFYGVNVC